MQNKESEIKHHDSLGMYEETHLVSADSTVNTEEQKFSYNTGDSSMDFAMNMTVDADKEFANTPPGLSNNFPPRPTYTPITVTYEKGKVIVDPGGRNIKTLDTKLSSKGKQIDSSVNNVITYAGISKKDSAVKKQTVKVIDSSAVKTEVKTVAKKKTPWYLYAIAGLTLALITAVVLYIKKPSII